MTFKEKESSGAVTSSGEARGLEDVARVRRQRQEAEAQETEEAQRSRDVQDRKQAARARLSNLGGLQLKLTVGHTIPGMHLFWENDVDNRIERLLGAGFDFVSPDEVGMQSLTKRIVEDSEVTNRVSKYVGTTEDGKAMRAYLLKCPEELWEDVQMVVNDLADERDRDILESANRADDRYSPKGFETRLNGRSR